jgi:rubrerythrin
MYDDFYNDDYSEMDQFLDELKQTALKNTKEEFLKKMERLEKENAELQEVKKNWNQLKREVEREKENYKFDKDKLEREIAYKKINELLDIANWTDKLYYITDVNAHLPKCNNCDDNRYIHFSSPTGKDCTEICPICGQNYYKYVVKECPTFRLKFNSEGRVAVESYFIKTDRWGDSTIYTKQNVYEGSVEDFYFNDSYKIRHTGFRSKELAQQICDKINKDNGVPDNVECEKE